MATYINIHGEKLSFKEKVKNKCAKVAKWVEENKRIIIPIVTVCVMSIPSILKAANKRAEIKEDKIRRTRTVYDHSLGCYWETKKDLCGRDLLEIERRKMAGQPLGEALENMNLLKK